MREPGAVRRIRVRHKQFRAVRSPDTIEQPQAPAIMDHRGIDGIYLQKNGLLPPLRWPCHHLEQRDLVRTTRFRNAEEPPLVNEQKRVGHVTGSHNGVLEIAYNNRASDLSAHNASRRLPIIEILAQEILSAFERDAERIGDEHSRPRLLWQPVYVGAPIRIQKTVNGGVDQPHIVQVPPEDLPIKPPREEVQPHGISRKNPTRDLAYELLITMAS